MSELKVAIASPYDSFRLPYNAMVYEFCKIAAEVSAADIIAPPNILDRGLPPDMVSPLDKARREMRRGVSTLRHRVGLPRLPSIQPVALEQHYDLFFFACTFVHDLPNLDHIEGWDTAGVKAVFILESWSNLLESQKRSLAYLDRFDHVFLLNKSSVPNVQRYTRTPCSFLPIAADVLHTSPLPECPARVIDVYSMGRRAPHVHEQMVRAMRAGEMFYVFDTTNSGSVLDWSESRTMTANLIKRSRYFVAFDHTVGSALKRMEAQGEVALSMRYFEGAAGGAVMIGSTPPCDEFAPLFDWPDAVIDIPHDSGDVIRFLAELDEDSPRLGRIRRDNVVEALTRHDWCHRWETVMATLDLPRSPALEARRVRLAGLASDARRRTWEG